MPKGRVTNADLIVHRPVCAVIKIVVRRVYHPTGDHEQCKVVQCSLLVSLMLSHESKYPVTMRASSNTKACPILSLFSTKSTRL